MDINVIATGSKGNLVVMEHEGSQLLLEAGLPIRQIRRALDHKLSGVDACLVSHSHADHSKSVKDLMKYGTNVYMSAGTKEALGLKDSHRLFLLSHMTLASIWTGEFFWRIVPFDTIHDDPEPLGFLIGAGDEKVLYATDTAYIPHQFQGLTRIIVECNWQDEYVTDCTYADRLLLSHMSLNRVIQFLKATDLSGLRQPPILFHPSDHNLDMDEAQNRVSEVLYGKEET